ncbi:glycosyltransferase family 4 protein [Serratia fonticola]
MKITFLIDNLERSGGTEKVTTMIANAFAVSGHDVHIMTLKNYHKSYFPLSDNISVRSLAVDGGRFKNILHRFYFINKLASKGRDELFIVVDTMLFLYFLPSSIWVKNIVCWEQFIFTETLGSNFRKIARFMSIKWARDIVTLTERDKNFWINAGAKESVVTVIPNPSSFEMPAREMSILEKKVVLSVGRLEKVKGFERLIKAWSLIAKNNREWILKIVGSGNEEASLKKLVSEYGIDNNVVFIPSTIDVVQHYMSSGIYCLSSYFEGFGMVLVEALSCSLPVVSFDCEAGPKEILNEACAVLCPNGDIDALALSLQSLIDDDNRRLSLSNGAYLRGKMYSIHSVMKLWNEVLYHGAQSNKA